MVIGDTVHDIRCARSIGACAVAVPTGNTSADQLANKRLIWWSEILPR